MEQIRRAMLFLLLGLLLLVSCEPVREPGHTIFLVRHAEKDLRDTTDNPPLTREGEARAEKIVTLLEKENVDAIYSTRFERNINTVLPLGEAQGVEIQLYDWHDWHQMVEDIKNGKTPSTTVICGHGDNLIPMIWAFGAEPPLDSLCHDEYDKMFKVEYWRDTVIVEQIVY